MAMVHHFANPRRDVCHFHQFATIRLSSATCGSARSIVLESSCRPSVVVISPGNSFSAASMVSICGTLALTFRQIFRGNFRLRPVARSGSLSIKTPPRTAKYCSWKAGQKLSRIDHGGPPCGQFQSMHARPD